MVRWRSSIQVCISPEGGKKSRRSAWYAGKAMDGVKRKIRASEERRSIIVWIDRNELNLDCNWHEKGTQSGEMP
jgi:hypothetical protein